MTSQEDEIFGKEDDSIKIGDRVVLTNQKKAIWDPHIQNFRDAINVVGYYFIVNDIKIIKKEICAFDIGDSYYKISNLKKLEH